MKVFRDIHSYHSSFKTTNSTGFVPTMGALHAGHGSLIAASMRQNDFTVASVFVNPRQFNNPDDFKSYPRNEAADLQQLEEWGVDVAFVPEAKEIYADGYRYQVTESEESKILCGAHRPGHFNGVLTVVLKLFNIVRPERAYFGEKDFQQLRLIQGMVDALHVPITIVPCPTIRETDGLAMSSRNAHLTPQERERAADLPKVLRHAASAEAARAELTRLGFEVDYVEDRWERRLAAATLGKVRLIDNVEL